MFVLGDGVGVGGRNKVKSFIVAQKEASWESGRSSVSRTGAPRESQTVKCHLSPTVLGHIS